MVPAGIQTLYDASIATVHRVHETVRDKLVHFCEPHLYPYVGRIKTAESVAEKIESGRYRNWAEIDDLFACTIIIPHLGAEQDVVDYVEREFRVHSKKGRGLSKKDPELFRFDQPRIYARLICPDPTLATEPLYTMVFEVQIRSAFEHAWIAATHPMIYKGDELNWNRLRLAAMMKASVEQLDTLNLTFAETASKIMGSEWVEVSLKQEVVRRFKQAVEGGAIPSEAAPASWRRFADNFVTLVSSEHGWRALQERGEEAIGIVIGEIEGRYAGDKFLRSISLLQLVLGILCDRDFVTRNVLARYTPLITPELQTFFPKAGTLNGFEFALHQ